MRISVALLFLALSLAGCSKYNVQKKMTFELKEGELLGYKVRLEKLNLDGPTSSMILLNEGPAVRKLEFYLVFSKHNRSAQIHLNVGPVEKPSRIKEWSGQPVVLIREIEIQL